MIKTSNEILVRDPFRENMQAKTGEFVMLSVGDNGHGMTSEIRKKATEPFFTMKEASKGTGLGLSMVYGFVHRSGGHMEIISEPDKGTEVRLYLPRVQEEIDCESGILQPSALIGGHERVLIVDDEKALVDIALSHLQSLGYETITAYDSLQALELLRSTEGIDLLFADVIMPGDMDGFELAIVARQLRPDLKILMTSGFTRKNDVMEASVSESNARLLSNLLRKPYDKPSLCAAVRKALDEPVDS